MKAAPSQKSSLHWQLNLVLLSVLLTVVVYAGASIYAGWHDVVTVMRQVGWTGLAVALLLSLGNYVIRFARWQYYLHHLGYRLAAWRSWNIYLSGFALTTTPGKAGEAVRSMFLSKHQIPASASLAALISERLSDLIAIVLLSCIGLLEYPAMRAPIIAAMILLVSVWGVVMYRPFLDKMTAITQGKPQKWAQIVNKTVHILLQAQRCNQWQKVILTTAISTLAWAMEGWAFYLLLHWCGFDISVHFAFFVYAVSMLAGALSFLPGGLGGAEATMVSLLFLKGIDQHSALAITIFIRLTTLWFAVLLGVLALWREKRRP